MDFSGYIKSPPRLKRSQALTHGPLDLEKAMAKEKPEGVEFSAAGKQTMARAP